MLKLIYIAHPFGGEQENVEKVEKIIKGLLHKHPNCTIDEQIMTALRRKDKTQTALIDAVKAQMKG